jgi:hypothetical protein
MVGPGQHRGEAGHLVEHRALAAFLAGADLFAQHVLGGLVHHHHHAADSARVVEHGGISEVEVDGVVTPVTMKNQFLIVEGDDFARAHPPQEIAVPLGNLGPGVGHRQRHLVHALREHRISVVVDHQSLVAPQDDHADGAAQHHADHPLETCWPLRGPTETNGLPVSLRDLPRRFGGGPVEKGGERSRGIGEPRRIERVGCYVRVLVDRAESSRELAYTATGAEMCGCGSYPTTSKSSRT